VIGQANDGGHIIESTAKEVEYISIHLHGAYSLLKYMYYRALFYM
jgi:hypothetical protein